MKSENIYSSFVTIIVCFHYLTVAYSVLVILLSVLCFIGDNVVLILRRNRRGAGNRFH